MYYYNFREDETGYYFLYVMGVQGMSFSLPLLPLFSPLPLPPLSLPLSPLSLPFLPPSLLFSPLHPPPSLFLPSLSPPFFLTPLQPPSYREPDERGKAFDENTIKNKSDSQVCWTDLQFYHGLVPCVCLKTLICDLPAFPLSYYMYMIHNICRLVRSSEPALSSSLDWSLAVRWTGSSAGLKTLWLQSPTISWQHSTWSVRQRLRSRLSRLWESSTMVSLKVVYNISRGEYCELLNRWVVDNNYG